MDHVLSVWAEWDGEAHVWFVVGSDVPGLATEATTLDGLNAKLKVMVPELLELNLGGDFDFAQPSRIALIAVNQPALMTH